MSIEDASPAVPLSWFWAAALYRAVHNGEAETPGALFERTVFLLRAASDDAAREKTETLARAKEQAYIGGTGDLVSWELVKVEEVQRLLDDEFADGTEVYWEFFD